MTEEKTAGRTRSYRWVQDIPVIQRTEVLVVGGGSSGIAAAVASARNGAQTLLIDRYGFLGGTSTAGLVGPFMTSYSADGKTQVVRGIFQEMVERMVALGGAIDPGQVPAKSPYCAFIELGHAHVTPFHAEALKMAALDLIEEAGVELLLHTSFLDTIMEGEVITGVVVANKGGLGIIEAERFIDTSADADVAARAGVPYQKGRPQDGLMQPATLFFRIGNVDDAAVQAWVEEHERIHPGERLFHCLVQEAREKGEFPVPRQHIGIYRELQPGVWRVNT
ncbi:MAG: FAD-dependent oxidoreductase, partial [Nitrospinota bacterium]